MEKRAIVLFSGELDSATVLVVANAGSFETYALSMRYGQRHSSELEAAKKVAAALGAVRHEIADLDLRRFGGSALTDDTLDVPTDGTQTDIPITYAPARNTIMLSLALGWTEAVSARDLFSGMNAVDYSGYPDCRPEYVAAYETLTNLAAKASVEGERIRVNAPTIDMTKAEVIQADVRLGVDHGLTVSCYKVDDVDRACGVRDSCRIRKAGFEATGVPDPIRYVRSTTPDIDLNVLSYTVLQGTFVLVSVFGAILQRTHLCTMGAMSDVVNISDWNRLCMWALAIDVAMIGTGCLSWLGLIDTSRTIYTANKLLWLSSLVGGLLFGLGMVLGSGCGSKTLVRIGGGNLRSVVVFVFLGLAAYMTLKGVFGVMRMATVNSVAVTLPTSQDLPSVLGYAFSGDVRMLHPVPALGIDGALSLWALLGRNFCMGNNLLGGIGVGLIIVGMWYVSGHLGYVQEGPNMLQEAFMATSSGHMEALDFMAPVSYTLEWLIFFSDTSKVLTVGIVNVLGVIAGSAAVTLTVRTFRWEGFANAEDTGNHIIGGILMGIGGVAALGCTIGQGSSGVSTLTIGSFIALADIVIGAVLTFRYQMWRMEQLV